MFFPQPFLFTPVGVPAAPAQPWEDLVSLGTVDGWQSIYDMNNPNTWDLRDAGGGSMFYESVADGLGNRDPLIQATTGSQPPQVTQGDHLMAEFNASRLLARATGSITSPRVIVSTIRATSSANFRNYIGDGANNFFAQTGTYGLLISDASTNLSSADNVFTSGQVAVVSAIWNSGTNGAKIRVNGSQVYQGTLTPPSFSGLRIGYNFTGQIGFIGIYQGLLSGSSDALSRMEDLLMEQHGIS